MQELSLSELLYAVVIRAPESVDENGEQWTSIMCFFLFSENFN